MTFRLKLSNGEEKFIKYLTFSKKNESMYFKILSVLNNNLKLKFTYLSDKEKDLTITKIIFRYKIVSKKVKINPNDSENN